MSAGFALESRALDIEQFVELAWASHRGTVRPTNQDFAFAGPVPGAPEWGLVLVADGVGGQGGGDWASQRASAIVTSRLHAYLAESDPAEALARAVEAANDAIYREGPSQGYTNPATTLVAGLVGPRSFWWANVGDSRIYTLRQNRLGQLSKDHSVVAERVRAGLMTPREARLSPERNVITRAIGSGPGVEVDSGGPIPWSLDDVLFACSDGIHGLFDDGELIAVLRDRTAADAAAFAVSSANLAGANDNVSIAIGRRTKEAIETQPQAANLEPGDQAAPARPSRSTAGFRQWVGRRFGRNEQ